jgi:hypothetical protein
VRHLRAHEMRRNRPPVAMRRMAHVEGSGLSHRLGERGTGKTRRMAVGAMNGLDRRHGTTTVTSKRLRSKWSTPRAVSVGISRWA